MKLKEWQIQRFVSFHCLRWSFSVIFCFLSLVWSFARVGLHRYLFLPFISILCFSTSSFHSLDLAVSLLLSLFLPRFDFHSSKKKFPFRSGRDLWLSVAAFLTGSSLIRLCYLTQEHSLSLLHLCVCVGNLKPKTLHSTVTAASFNEERKPNQIIN